MTQRGICWPPNAFTDVGGGANFDSPDPAGGIQTIARRDGEEWGITGQKHYTTNGTGGDEKGVATARPCVIGYQRTCVCISVVKLGEWAAREGVHYQTA